MPSSSPSAADEVGMTGRQIPGIAQPEAGAERAARCHRPHRLRHLITAGRRVRPWRLPHQHALRERARDMQQVSEREAGDEQREPRKRHGQAGARDRIDREEDAAQQQRRSQILLHGKQRQRGGGAAGDRQDVLHPRHVHPRRQVDAANRAAAQPPQQFPPPREIPGEEEREQQADRLDRLHRPEIDLCAAASRAGSERDEQRAQPQRRRQRQVAELHERRAAEVGERARGHQSQAEHHTLRVADEQRDVAKRIGPAQEHGKAEPGDEVRGRQQQAIAVDAPQAPEECGCVKADDVEQAPRQQLVPELRARADDEGPLDRGDVSGGEERHRRGRRPARRGRRLASRGESPGEEVELRVPIDLRGRDRQPRGRADIRDDLAAVTRAREHAEPFACRKLAVAGVGHHRREPGLERGRPLDRVEVDGRIVARAIGSLQRGKPAGIGQRQHQRDDAGGCRQQQVADCHAREPRAAPACVALRGRGEGYGHGVTARGMPGSASAAGGSDNSASRCCT